MKNNKRYTNILLVSTLLGSILPSFNVVYAEEHAKTTELQKQRGLIGTFYKDRNFKNLIMIQANSLVKEKPVPHVQSIRWKGYIKPIKSGSYTFSASENTQIKMQVDNQIVLNEQLQEQEIQLQKDKLYPIIVEYQTNSESVDPFAVFWSIDHQKKEPIPQDVLYAPDLSQDKEAKRENLQNRSKRSISLSIEDELHEKDTDKDNIPDSWEFEGYTVENGEFGVQNMVRWDDNRHNNMIDSQGNPLVKYRTSPMKWSTSDDPYSDYEKVTGLQMDTRVTREAQHPLVAAYPDVHIDMHKYIVIPNTHFQQGQGNSASKQVTRGTSSTLSTTDSWGATVTASASLIDFGGSVSASYESSTTNSVTKDEAISDSTTKDWNTVLGVNNTEFGKILPNIRYVNTGTAPVFNVKPQFTLHFPKTIHGEAISLVSSSIGESHKGLEVLPGRTYPQQSNPPLAFDKPTHIGEALLLDQRHVNRLQKNDLLKVTTNGIDAKVVLIDTQGQDYESSQDWTKVISKIKANTAEITHTTENGITKKRNIAAPGTTSVERTVPDITFKEALKISHGATEKDGKIYIDNQEISKETVALIVDQKTEKQINIQDVQSIFDIKLKAGMHIEMRSKLKILGGTVKHSYVVDKANSSEKFLTNLAVKFNIPNTQNVVKNVKLIIETFQPIAKEFPTSIINRTVDIPVTSESELSTNIELSSKEMVGWVGLIEALSEGLNEYGKVTLQMQMENGPLINRNVKFISTEDNQKKVSMIFDK